MLEARGVSFGYGADDAVLRDLSLAVAPGEVVGLSGPSGSGKSTLARLLCGYLAPRSGRVLLDGAPLPSSGFCPVQMLFQTAELAVDPRWTIRRIIAEAHEPPQSLLRAFGVRDAWFGRHPHELSGGELQRVAIVRALDPRVRFIVADEISGMLDPLAQAEIWRGLLAFAAQRRVGMLVVAHDEALIARLATRRLFLAHGRNSLSLRAR